MELNNMAIVNKQYQLKIDFEKFPSQYQPKNIIITYNI